VNTPKGTKSGPARLSLRRISGGRVGVAVMALVGAHLAVLLLVLVVWFLGLAPIFDGVHWIPAVLATVVFVVGLAAVFVTLLPWAHEYEKLFSAGAVFVLSWLHWFAIVATGVAGILMVAMVWADLRWYHVVSSPEIDGLRDRAAEMPIPAEWSLDEAGERNAAFPADVYGYEQSFDVPQSYEFSQMADWLSSPEWEASFGALRDVECDDTGWCQADVVPREAGEPVYVIVATYRSSELAGSTPTVDVDLQYRITE
jgi:hypothetical protein